MKKTPWLPRDFQLMILLPLVALLAIALIQGVSRLVQFLSDKGSPSSRVERR